MIDYHIIETGRKEAYVAAGKSVVITYWNIGRRIVKEEQQGKERAEYGAEIIKNLALKIIPRYGASYNKHNLDYYKRFYLLFPDIQIVNTCVHNLSWSHIRRILSVSDPNARLWYLKTADKDMWSFRALDRNISTQYYERRYVRMYDDLIKGSDDAPTIGVLLCTDTDNTIARYSVLHDNNQLFAAKYMTYMPTEEELRNEIEQQKRFFMEQHGSHDLQDNYG